MLVPVLFGLLLVAAGVLGAASLIVKNQPNAREAIAKLVPFQGIIGIVLLLWSLIWLIRILPYISIFFSGLWGLIALLTLLVGVGLGFLLGYGLIKHYALSKSADASRGGDAMQLKLAGIQGPLGIAGIVLGLLWLINILTSSAAFY